MASVIKWTQAQGTGKVMLGLSKLPQAQGTYTFSVKKDKRIVSKWIFNKGKLIAVWHRPGYHESTPAPGN